jgi:ferrous iron transport protein B
LNQHREAAIAAFETDALRKSHSMPERTTISIALAGNPNCGKTTVFNNLTGLHQHVGNYPGVTVEKREGYFEHGGVRFHFVDLPGTYSLAARSLDERVATDFLLEERPAFVINVLDASALERNLYLTSQLLEMKARLVVVLNMMDIARMRRIEIDIANLATLLGAPVIPTIAHRGRGTSVLLSTLLDAIEGRIAWREIPVRYLPEVEQEIERLEGILREDRAVAENYPIRWLAVQALSGDEYALEKMKDPGAAERLRSAVKEASARLVNHTRQQPELLIADARYGFAAGLARECEKKAALDRVTLSDRIDRILLNRYSGLPIFLVMLWLVFQATFRLGDLGVGILGKFFAALGGIVSQTLPDSYIRSLIVDGVIGGVGGVLMFLPTIIVLFFAIALLEDSGYMARAAFLMDRIMHRIGLHGRSFIPLMMGFGCAVPAIMATRTLENPKDRLTTILIIPLMSCGARLPVYALLISAFFAPAIAGNVLFSIYLIGIAFAVLMAKLMRRYLFRGESPPFVLELPPYHLPTLKGMLLHTWERAKLYLRKAGTVILGFAIVFWLLCNLPGALRYSYDEFSRMPRSEQLAGSVVGTFGRAVAPVLRPLGFDWKIGVALTVGVGAKELFISSLGTLYGLSEKGETSEGLLSALREDVNPRTGRKLFNPLVAYVLMIFILLYSPCMPALAMIRSETRSWGLPLFAMAYLTALAWVVSFIVYRAGLLLGFGG